MASSLKINLHKSNLFGVCVSGGEVEDFASVVGCRTGKFLFNYLGLHIIIDLFQKKLCKWKVKTLSIGGRSILLKSILGSLENYFRALFLMPVGVVKDLEAFRTQFFLGGDVDNRKMPWVKWDVVIVDKKWWS